MSEAAVQQVTARLMFRREAWTTERGKVKRLESRDAQLPEKPSAYRPMVGPYSEIAAEAVLLNQVQQRAGFQDYLYWPEIVSEPKPAAA